MNRNLSQFHGVQISVPLSKLIPNKRNPRRVKPERDAHRQKVASIRAFGLIQPLDLATWLLDSSLQHVV